MYFRYPLHLRHQPRFSKVVMMSFVPGWLRRAPQDHRSYSTVNTELKSTILEKFDPRLRSVFHQLDALAPRFMISATNIKILTSPSDFYDSLKVKILQAKRRVFLSSLYVGKSQHELIDTIDQALTQNPSLEVHILTDYLRGTREAPEEFCSGSLLVPLVEKHGKHRVNIRMYHTPNLYGLTKQIMPRRLNESYGLQHMKIYGFDDEVMLSGANLSEDYFTNRQDRYYIFSDKKFADYYYLIQASVSRLSYQLLPSAKKPEGFRLSWPTSNASCEPSMNPERFLLDSTFLLSPILKYQPENEDGIDTEADNDSDTIVYAISQFTPLLKPGNDISTEKPAILRLLSYLDSPTIKWWFTAGYFNMLQEIQEKLLNAKASGKVVTAAPQANSFYKSPGLSYYIPEAYLLCAKNFLEAVSKAGKDKLISVYEWSNGIVNTPEGWSYHAKGLWITEPDNELPSITVVGSSNYTKRAYSLDLESNAIVITSNRNLQQSMQSEISNLMQYANPMRLEDFEPKARRIGATDDKEASMADDRTIWEIDENRRISRRVHLLYRLFGGSM